jgi:hypothetical protein
MQVKHRLFDTVTPAMREGYKEKAIWYGLSTKGLVFFGETSGSHFYYEFGNGQNFMVRLFLDSKGPFFKAMPVESYGNHDYLANSMEFRNAAEVNKYMRWIRRMEPSEEPDNPRWTDSAGRGVLISELQTEPPPKELLRS